MPAGESFPDVLGLKLTEAVVILEQKGFTLQIRRTAPPQGFKAGTERVVRVLPRQDDLLEITVAAENWG
ncbi:MAG: hypothetical protein GX893_07360 [Firmicutes bacterium]|nr:hypothetical protein [Bacillota bacterium]